MLGWCGQTNVASAAVGIDEIAWLGAVFKCLLGTFVMSVQCDVFPAWPGVLGIIELLLTYSLVTISLSSHWGVPALLSRLLYFVKPLRRE
jgi:hypothetical protein